MTERASVALRDRFIKANRSAAYRFTSISYSNVIIDALKAEVKIANAKARVIELKTGKKQIRQRVVLKGRLGKHNIHAPLYRKGGVHWRFASITIRPEHATRWDVYVHEVFPEGYLWSRRDEPVDTSNLTIIDRRS
jgi:hypothetical protein